MDVVGDEEHALTQCLRGERARASFLNMSSQLFRGAEVPENTCNDVFTMASSLHLLLKCQQKKVWNGLARVTQAVDHDIQAERDMQHNAPDMWTIMFRKMQTKLLIKAAEKAFRRGLRKQIRRARDANTIIINSDDSDEDVVVVSQTLAHMQT